MPRRRAINPALSQAQRLRRARERAAHKEWLSRPENAGERAKIYVFWVVLILAMATTGALTLLGFKTR
jgi:hypothetical protein